MNILNLDKNMLSLLHRDIKCFELFFLCVRFIFPFYQ